MLYLTGATFIEPAKISTIAVRARIPRASYTGTWPQPGPALYSTDTVGSKNLFQNPLKCRRGRVEEQRQEASEYVIGKVFNYKELTFGSQANAVLIPCSY